MAYKLKANADGTATVLDDKGVPLALVPDDAGDDAAPEPIVVSMDGYEPVQTDPLAGLADNPQFKAILDQNKALEARLAKAEREKLDAAITTKTDKLIASLVDPNRVDKDGRVIGPACGKPVAEKIALAYRQALADDHANPLETGSRAEAIEAMVKALPSLDARAHATHEPEDAETDDDGDRVLPHDTAPKGSANGVKPMTEAEYRQTLNLTDAGRKILADPGKYQGVLTAARARGTVK